MHHYVPAYPFTLSPLSRQFPPKEKKVNSLLPHYLLSPISTELLVSKMTFSTTPPNDVGVLDKFHTHDDPRHARLTPSKATTAAHATPPSPPHNPLDIIDIRRDALGLELDLGRDIMAQLAPKRGPKKMPTLLLYDEKGLQTFEEVGFSAPCQPRTIW